MICAAKAAIENLSQSVAAAVGKDNIRVNTIHPGWTLTDAILGAQGVGPDGVEFFYTHRPVEIDHDRKDDEHHAHPV